MSNSYKSHSRGVSELKAHLVLTTKWRRKVINAEILEQLKQIIENVYQKWGCTLVECNGDADQIHLLFQYYVVFIFTHLLNVTEPLREPGC